MKQSDRAKVRKERLEAGYPTRTPEGRLETRAKPPVGSKYEPGRLMREKTAEILRAHTQRLKKK